METETPLPIGPLEPELTALGFRASPTQPVCGCMNYPIVISSACSTHGHEFAAALEKYGDWERPQRSRKTLYRVNVERSRPSFRGKANAWLEGGK